MGGLKKASQALVLLLLLDAGWVFLGLIRGQNMWAWICAYWMILTTKNAVDWTAGRKRNTNDQAKK